MPKRVAVLLSGCGVFDGSDIHAAVLTLLALDRAGAEAVCTAPNRPQHHVLNHLNQEEMDEQRNVLVESARIALGDICDLAHLHANHLDAVIIPGGFGSAKNLSDFALAGPDAQIEPQVERLLKAMFGGGKPMAATGIAAATLVKALAGQNIEVTMGDDPATAAAIETMGGRHRLCPNDRVHVDTTHKIITTPAYTLESGIKEVMKAIELLVENILDLIK
jgi:enhancing lycopene biosynthesis protein 2